MGPLFVIGRKSRHADRSGLERKTQIVDLLGFIGRHRPNEIPPVGMGISRLSCSSRARASRKGILLTPARMQAHPAEWIARLSVRLETIFSRTMLKICSDSVRTTRLIAKLNSPKVCERHPRGAPATSSNFYR
jgi:hypothetical protein